MALKVVVFPLAVGFGEMLPHCATLHVTAQVTPMPDESPVTVAVRGALPVAVTEFAPAETATVMLEEVMVGELPPQPGIIIAEASARTVRAKETLPFMCALRAPASKTDAIRKVLKFAAL